MPDLTTSISQAHGLAYVPKGVTAIYSVGVSTGGEAEILMARHNTGCQIVATTIDQAGLRHAQERVEAAGYTQHIRLKIENVATALPYESAFFDYVYARLVLHYLSASDLSAALTELHRILKPSGKIFVIVRSTICPDAQLAGNMYDPSTKLTTVINETGNRLPQVRYFHTTESITDAVRQAGFVVEHTAQYDEQLYIDFARTQIAPQPDNVIEVLAKARK